MFSASSTSTVRRQLAFDQRKTRRLKASATAARNRNPARVSTYVRSATQKAVGRNGLEPALNEIRSWAEPVIVVRVALRLDAPAQLSHQLGHALATDLNAGGGKLGVNSRRCVSAAVAMMDVADPGLVDSIVLLTRRQVLGET